MWNICNYCGKERKKLKYGSYCSYPCQIKENIDTDPSSNDRYPY